MAGTIISFGAPRSGTTFMEVMWKKSKFINLVDPFYKNYKICTEIDFEKLNQIYRNLSKEEYHALKVGEGLRFHPINSQIFFMKFINIFPKPLYLIRTYRSAVEMYKSLIFIGNSITIGQRFKTWDINSVAAMLLCEYGAFLAIKDKYNIVSVDFDKFNKIEYVKNKLESIDLEKKIISNCLKFIKKYHRKRPVRKGRLSENMEIELEESMTNFLLKIDKIRNTFE
ncbi:MAG: hypothetical protein EU548_07330 [Promethearchaeota archaeon]|nr:MAG: hypothetical protein EU548_07330 [Candidatus Lokiarchaeota archaeon]